MEWKEKERIFVERMDKKKLMHKQKKKIVHNERKENSKNKTKRNVFCTSDKSKFEIRFEREKDYSKLEKKE